MNDDFVMTDAQVQASQLGRNVSDLVEAAASAMLLDRLLQGEQEPRPATWRDVGEIAEQLSPDEDSPQRTTCLKFLSEFICRMEKVGVFQVDTSNGCIWRDHTDSRFVVAIPGSFRIVNVDRAIRIAKRLVAEVENRIRG